MQVVSRTYVFAAAALAATGAVAVAPFTLQTSQPPVRHMEARLVDASTDVLNIPINLFDDFANIPSNEVQGLDVFANSLLFSGDWWVPNATNLWGTDPGDIGHYMGIMDLLVPFSSISGLDQPEIDPTAMADGTAGLAQQISMLAAAELPLSASCDAQTCFPMTPPEVITGSTALDRDIGFFDALDGTANNSQGSMFSLFSDWLKVPLSDLTSGDYTFTPSDDPGLLDPSPDTGTDGSVASGFGFDGTTGVDGTGAGDYVPWAGDTFKLNLFGPFEDFYNSLLATPSTTGIDGTGIDLPSLTDVTQSLQNFAAGTIVAFDPFVPGSPACPATCDLPAADTQTALLQDVLNWDPSNTTVQDYLSSIATDSTATTAEVDDATALLQTGEFNLSYENLLNYDADLAAINPELPTLFTNAGIVTDPNYVAYADGTTSTFDPTYGGWNPYADFDDYTKLLTNNDWNFTALENDLSNPETLYYLLDPASQNVTTGTLPGASDLGSAASADPSLSTDMGALMTALGATSGADSMSSLMSELSSQLTADLAAFVPQSLLGMF